MTLHILEFLKTKLKTYHTSYYYMKKASLSILTIAALFASSCSKDRSNAVVPVNVNVADFAISQSDYPAKDASSVASYANVKAIMLAFFDENGNQQYVNTQLRADASTYEILATSASICPSAATRWRCWAMPTSRLPPATV